MYSYENMSAGQIYNWLDQTPVVLLEEVTMPEDDWGGPSPGWRVFIVETEEIRYCECALDPKEKTMST